MSRGARRAAMFEAMFRSCVRERMSRPEGETAAILGGKPEHSLRSQIM